MEKMFEEFSEQLEEENRIREQIKQIVKEIEKISRQQTAILQNIHTKENILHRNMQGLRVHLNLRTGEPICSKVQELYPLIAEQFQQLKHSIDPKLYFKYLMMMELCFEQFIRRYRDHWKYTISHLVFIASLTHWLQTGQLTSIKEVSSLFGCSYLLKFYPVKLL
jgi:predicted translin family RNA/ssDNA-binding protein